MSLKFDHVHIKCSNIQKTRKFYQSIFDAKKVYEGSIRGIPFVMLEIKGAFINLSGLGPDEEHFAETNSVKGKVWKRIGLGHFGIRVDNLEETVASLKEKGVEFIWEITNVREGVKVAFIKAPEGNVIEILERRS